MWKTQTKMLSTDTRDFLKIHNCAVEPAIPSCVLGVLPRQIPLTLKCNNVNEQSSFTTVLCLKCKGIYTKKSSGQNMFKKIKLRNKIGYHCPRNLTSRSLETKDTVKNTGDQRIYEVVLPKMCYCEKKT
uniref:uncharacterized protein LOC113474076 n=1 Tax=Ciona intestinalis TaxID=7719 RepID=UPI000EF48C8F|nr:uncharacterized protein LOC113474076 [Ciona intestinalis]|eukprot:XP_026689365.1 uncharacterized protein LOC113474076 [Ciona intestinalis]